MPVRRVINGPVVDALFRVRGITVALAHPPELAAAIRWKAVGVQWDLAQESCHFDSCSHRPFSRELQLARTLAHLHVVHAEIHQMTSAVGNIASSGA